MTANRRLQSMAEVPIPFVNKKETSKDDVETGKKTASTLSLAVAKSVNTRRNKKKRQKGATKPRHNCDACKHCDQNGHSDSDCWGLLRNAHKRPANFRSRSGQNSKHRNGFRKYDSPTRSQVIAAMKVLKKAQKANSGDASDDEALVLNHRKRKAKMRIDDVDDGMEQSVESAKQSTTQTRNAGTKPMHANPNEAGKQSNKRQCKAGTKPGHAKPLLSHFLHKNGQTMKSTTAKAASREINNNKRQALPKEYANPFFNRNERNAKRPKKLHYSAEIVVEIEDRHGNLVPIRGLLDTGTSSSIVLREFVCKGRANTHKGKRTTWSTLGGTFTTNRKALIDFKFPELSTHKKVTWITHVDDKTKSDEALYDFILGMDIMNDIGIYVNTETKTINWEGATIPLKERGALQDANVTEMLYHLSVESKQIAAAEERRKRILDADYSKIDTDDHVDELSHLSDDQKGQLKTTLKKHGQLFSGGLGTLNVRPIHLELVEGAVPHHARAFPIPKSLEETTKKEMQRLTDIGVFKKTYDSEWAAPTFVQPKKTGDVRILTDFRRVNAMIKRKPFPLPKISDLLQKLSGFKFAAALDLSMGYYHLPLDAASQKLCTTILPYKKYQYLRLPMGIKNSPDVFQAVMMDILGDLEFVRTYIDDILITSNGTFEDHMKKLDQVLDRLTKAGFRANVRKCSFAQDELEYLGYNLTRNGIQPQPKKVEAILRLSPPKNKRALRTFLGSVNYYRDMWQRRSHVLTPLTGMVGPNAKFEWKREQQEAFDEMKRLISKETLLTFPDFSKEFHVYTDSSAHQLGAVIMQEGKPLAFYSRKMNSAQRRYTTGEQELLSIVETLKEFRNILLGQQLIVHTDHKNILYGKLSNDRIARWRLLLEEYGPTYVHIKGKDNVVADALSRLNADFPADSMNVGSDEQGQVSAHVMCALIRNEAYLTPSNNRMIAKKMVQAKDIAEAQFPLMPTLIHQHQKDDKEIKAALKKNPAAYDTSKIEDVELITFRKRIYLPKALRARVVAWYHEYLSHPGQTRMERTLAQTLYWPKMAQDVHNHVRTCKKCQMYKGPRKEYGHLPAKQWDKLVPWQRVDIDMIGPMKIKTPSGNKELRALTMIDPATGWFEVKDVASTKAKDVMAAFDDTWLCRYPRPQYLGFDGGSEFKAEFEQMRKNYSMKARKSSAYNPQANGVIERVHQVLNNCLRTYELEKQELDERDPFGPFLAAAAFAVRSTFHTTLQATPAQLVFHRDMLLPIQHIADWALINERKQQEINKNNERENRKRISHTYAEGDKVLLEIPKRQRKHQKQRDGPYTIEKVNTNGTIRIRRKNVSDLVNIRRVTPFIE